MFYAFLRNTRAKPEVGVKKLTQRWLAERDSKKSTIQGPSSAWALHRQCS